jgi:hypothetical protein
LSGTRFTSCQSGRLLPEGKSLILGAVAGARVFVAQEPAIITEPLVPFAVNFSSPLHELDAGATLLRVQPDAL